MTYPIAIGSDTGALSDYPRKALELAGAQPTLVGGGLGLLAGLLMGKNILVSTAIGAISGKFLLPGASSLLK